jgi:hypothetical protein
MGREIKSNRGSGSVKGRILSLDLEFALWCKHLTAGAL